MCSHRVLHRHLPGGYQSQPSCTTKSSQRQSPGQQSFAACGSVRLYGLVGCELVDRDHHGCFWQQGGSGARPWPLTQLGMVARVQSKMGRRLLRAFLVPGDTPASFFERTATELRLHWARLGHAPRPLRVGEPLWTWAGHISRMRFLEDGLASGRWLPQASMAQLGRAPIAHSAKWAAGQRPPTL